MGTITTLYERDFYAWTREQAQLIKARTFGDLDIAHLLEEIEDRGNRHADEVESRLCVLLTHLLKWKFQSNLQSKSWQFIIREQRRGIAKRLKKMPSLANKIPELFIEAYDDAIFEAEKETGLDASTFPKNCIWSVEEVLDDKFLPC